MAFKGSTLTYKKLLSVEKDLGYIFRDKWILAQAFLVPGTSQQYDNTRLAWIGDSVMGLAICHTLYDLSVVMSVESLNDRKTILVKRTFCAECTSKMGWEKLTPTPAVGTGQVTQNLQAELSEAVLGAQFVDSYGDYKAVLASYRRIVSMKDLKQVFEDMEDAWRKKAQSLDLRSSGAFPMKCYPSQHSCGS